VLITAYQRPQFINDSINSALAQDYSPLEVLVVDDGSDTPIIDFIEKKDKIRYIRTGHKGLPFGLIKGVEEAEGDLISILDHDDTLTGDNVRRCASVLSSDRFIGLVYGDANYMDNKGIVYTSQKFRSYSSSEKFIEAIFCSFIGPYKHPGSMFRKEYALKVGNYDPRLREDFDNEFFARLAGSYGVKNIESPLINYRNGGTSSTSRFGVRLSILRERLGNNGTINRHVHDPIKRVKCKAYSIASSLLKFAYERFSNKRPQYIFSLLGRR
jgi:glycosyltransferase involved in cell wall biosynthesis